MTPTDWLLSRDTGISSETILAVMTGSEIERPGVPHDTADFGRCHRLLGHFPEWRSRMPGFRSTTIMGTSGLKSLI